MRRLEKGSNDLSTVNPELASEWHPTRNGELRPDQVTAHSGKKVWWLGKCGHEWQAVVNDRSAARSGCPYCSGKRVLEGFNDLATVDPGLAAEWHPTRNGSLRPTQVTAGTAKKVWWECANGHEWQAAVGSRHKGIGCPYCSGKRAVAGENDLATVDPELAAEWHPTRNGELRPDQVTAHSGKKVWWLGKCGHEWQAVVSNRSKGANCPFCSHPHERKSNERFLKELAAAKSKVVPLEPYAGNSVKILMRCGECGHEWKVSPASILNNPERCPKCWEGRRGQALAKSNDEFVSDLAEVNPRVTPLEPYRGSKEKLRCLCAVCGHEWEATPNSLLRGTGCPNCDHSQTSYVEQCIHLAFSLRLGGDAVLSRDRSVVGSELDVYVPSKSLAVEYGAWYWHRGRVKGDREKAAACEGRGIRLVEVYDDFPKNEADPPGLECVTFHSPLSLAQNRPQLRALLDLLLGYADLQALSDGEFADVTAGAYRRSRRKTTAEFVAELAAVTEKIEVIGQYRASNRKIDVRCKACGHEWAATPGNLLSGHGCPRCKGLNHGVRSRKTHGRFLSELSARNPAIEVVGTYVKMKEKVEVRCKVCGYEWLADPGRLLNGHGCPKCAGRHQGVVVCLETGKEYPNYAQAAKAVGLTGSAGVKDSCNNPNRTAGGCHWRLKEG